MTILGCQKMITFSPLFGHILGHRHGAKRLKNTKKGVQKTPKKTPKKHHFLTIFGPLFEHFFWVN